MFWKRGNCILARTTTATPRLIIGGLALAFLILSACQQDSPTSVSQGITPTNRSVQIAQNTIPTLTSSPTLVSQGISPTSVSKSAQSIPSTPTRISAQRNHIPSGTSPLFARITFTTPTTYDQAVAILTAAGDTPYPWTCDDPRTPTPPSLAQQRAAFASLHQLLVSYPSDSLLNQLASSSQVVSVDAAPLYMCP